MTKSKAELTVVQTSDVGAVVEIALAEARDLTVSGVSRVSLVRNEQQLRVNGLEAEKRTMQSTREMVVASSDTALKAIDAELADIDAALALLPGEPS